MSYLLNCPQLPSLLTISWSCYYSLLSTDWNITRDLNKMAATNGAMEYVSVDGVTQVQVMIMQTSNTLMFDIPRFLILLVSFILYWRLPHSCRVWMVKWSVWAVELICTARLISLFNKVYKFFKFANSFDLLTMWEEILTAAHGLFAAILRHLNTFL